MSLSNNTGMKELTKTAFNDLLASKKTFLVDFFATWCGPCKMMEPELEKVSKLRTDIDLFSIDSDQYPDLTSQYDVLGLPTILLFKNGVLADRQVGYIDAKKINSFLDSHL